MTNKTQKTTYRSFHEVTFTDSEIGFLRDMVTLTLRDINELEKVLESEESKVWSKCNPDCDSALSKVSYASLNALRTEHRNLKRKKRQYEAVQKALRKCINYSVKVESGAEFSAEE